MLLVLQLWCVRFRRGAGALVLIVCAVATAPDVGATESGLTVLVDAAAERLQSADAVAAVKWLTKATIEDPVRAEQVLSSVTAEAEQAGVDPDYVRQVFDRMLHFRSSGLFQAVVR